MKPPFSRKLATLRRLDGARVQVTTADGRVLDVVSAGPAGGTAVLLHVGTPSEGLLYERFVEEGARRGLRHVTYSRPGYGGSTRHAGRSVADCAGDVAAIADQLGLERFHTAGWSGGGPHALATAALLGERVLSAATLASVAPFEADGLDWMAGMGEENVAEFGAMQEGPEALQAFLEEMAAPMRDIEADQVLEGLGDLVGPADEAVLSGAFAEYMADMIRGALRPGIWGWFDDDLAFRRHWGFDIAAIEVPVCVWQGDDDRFVPFAHGEWLAANVAGAQPRLLPGEGHLSIVLGAYGRVLDELVSAAA